MTDLIAEAQDVRSEEEAVELIQRVLAQHLDAEITVRRVHEVLEALPVHVDGLKAEITALVSEVGDLRKLVDEVKAKSEEHRLLFTEARDKAAGAQEAQQQRLSEERQARKKAAEEAQIQAEEAKARWTRWAGWIAALIAGVAALAERLGGGQ